MSKYVYGALLQWKLDMRNKGVLITYYLVPLIFFLFIGNIFTSIDPANKDTITQTMVVFAVSMGALLGTPIPLVEFYGSEVKKSYIVGGVPLWVAVLNNIISALIHLSIVSAIITILSPLALGGNRPENMSVFITAAVLVIISSVALGTVLGLLVKTTSKLTMISQCLFLPSLMLSGIMFPAEMLPEALQTVGKVFPATWGFEMMTKGSLQVGYIIPLIITVVISVIICAVRLKVRYE